MADLRVFLADDHAVVCGGVGPVANECRDCRDDTGSPCHQSRHRTLTVLPRVRPGRMDVRDHPESAPLARAQNAASPAGTGPGAGGSAGDWHADSAAGCLCVVC
jgi:hypothetical protein